MKTPEYHRIYSTSEFDHSWLEPLHTDDIIPVYLSTSISVDKPQFVVPFSARVYRTRYFVLDGKLQHENETLGMKNELPRNLRNRKSVVICELWQCRDDNREHVLRGYVFLSELEFLGDPQFSVNYDKITNSNDFKK